MAKAAVRALTRSAAREWGADKITVNNVMPIADTWEQRPMRPHPLTHLAVKDRPKRILRRSCCSLPARMRSS
ncbi:SDR family oxidoreductase [Pseudomonas laurylsulfativorans]|uniref:SDR family oxidoreductase n=1 Tax=Pseudomonas laurylsulfativorans TaxID=1943631 RepID=UPI001F0C99A9|nr:SDR family oxidoreductase [Pseudomonas laurylsulfativorans]